VPGSSSASPIEEIKARLDLPDVVSGYVQLRKSGRYLKGLCPFHQEKTPSFIVFPEKGTWHCFGCGKGGDVFSFVMLKENLDFRGALELLARRAGVSLRPAAGETEHEKRLRVLAEMNELAAAHFTRELLEGRSEEAEAARRYLAGRGVSDETARAFQLGYAPDRWDTLLRYLAQHGYSSEQAVEAGLVVQNERGGVYDRFRGRIMFPIRNERGVLTGFGGRLLEDREKQPKYLNTAQTALFDKGASLYGIDRAGEAIRRAREAILVEGYMDVVLLHQHGVSNAVASLGTSLTERQLEILKRLTERVVLALDADTAGDAATLRGLEVARQVFDYTTVPVPDWQGMIRFERRLKADLRVAILPPGVDPDELVRNDRAAWQRTIAEALPLVEYVMQVVLRTADLANPREKSRVVERLAPVLHEVADPVQRAHYVQTLARALRVEEGAVQRKLAEYRPVARVARRLMETSAAAEVPSGTAPAAHGGTTASRSPDSGEHLEEYLLAQLIAEPLVQEAALKALTVEDFARQENRELYRLLVRLAQQANGEPVPATAWRDALGSSNSGEVAVLVEHFDALARHPDIRPELPVEERALDVERCALRIRERNVRQQLEQVYVLLREAGDHIGEAASRDEPSLAALAQHVATLTTDLRRIQLALSTRTVLHGRVWDLVRGRP
jgi:DNA primase